MYHFVSAYLRPVGRNTTYQSVNISLMTLQKVHSGYIDGHIVLSNPAIQGPIYVDYQTLKQTSLPFTNLAFETWLGTLGNSAIPDVGHLPTYVKTSIRYSDATQAGYTVNRISREFPDNPGLSTMSKESLIVTRPGVPVDLLQSRVLTTVNGLLHINIPHDQGLMVVDGAASGDLAKLNRVGLISFNDIGDVQQVAVQPSMIEDLNPDTPTSMTVYVNLGINLTNKSLLMSLGGYLHVNTEAYTVIDRSVGLVAVDFTKIDLVRIMLDSQYLINLNSVLDEDMPDYPGAVSPVELATPEIIRQYLQISQSFFIVVDALTLYSTTSQLSNTYAWGVYESATEPRFPYIDTYGKLSEYWLTTETDHYMLSLTRNVQQSYVYETTDWVAMDSVNAITNPNDYCLEIGRLLEISSNVRTS